MLWSDLHNRLEVNAQGEIIVLEDIYAVMTSVSNILETRPGQRVMRPDFGSHIKDIIGEPLEYEGIKANLEEEIRSAIMTWEDRVNIHEIHLIPLYDQNAVRVTVIFDIILQPGKVFKFETEVR